MESTREIWQKALGELQTQVSRANFNTWLRDSHGVSYEAGLFTVATPSAFVAEWLTKRLHSLVRKTLTGVIGSETDIRFVVRESAVPQRQPKSRSAFADGATATSVSNGSTNDSRFTFDNFVGDCNRLAFATAVESAENPLSSFNPLYIYGGTGQGKTHLLQAIAHSAKERERDVLYLTAERFTQEFVTAVKQKSVDEFHMRFRSISVFLFDDIQFLATKRQTQQCFYHIFDELIQRNCQIAVSGDHHPREMQPFGEKLRSRLESGMVACIQPPDLEARIAFLEAKAAESDVELPAEAVKLIADEVRGNMRQLEGAIVYLSAQSKLTGEAINAHTVHRLLTSVSPSGDGRSIIHAVSDVFDVSVEDIIGPKRDKKTSLARHAAMYLMRKVTERPFTDIGKQLGNRHHATVMHGYTKILNEAAVNPRLERQLARVMEQLPASKAA